MNDSELEQLRKEVAGLKQQLRELGRFICINETASGKEKLVIKCSSIRLVDPEDDERAQCSLWAGEEGPQFKLYDQNEDLRVAIKVDKEEGGLIQVFQPEEKLAVHIGQDTHKHASVGVFDQGKPRAAIKASADAGMISAVHDGGQTRAVMMSQENSGELFLMNPDMKVVVKLSSKSQDDGGFITVNHSNGKAAVILSTLPDVGAVIVTDRGGNAKHSLPDPNKGKE